jgi:hypothetical protein
MEIGVNQPGARSEQAHADDEIPIGKKYSHAGATTR